MDAHSRQTPIDVSPRSPGEPRLVEEVTRSLLATGRPSLRGLEVLTSAGVVRLRGRVRSYYQKQMAQTAALNVIGPRQLVNEVEVG